MDSCVVRFYWSLGHPTHGWQRVDFGASRVTHTLTICFYWPLCHSTHGWQRVDFGASRVIHTLMVCFYWPRGHSTHGWQRVDFGASRTTHTLTFREGVPLSAHVPPFTTITEIHSALLGAHLPHVWSVLSQIRALPLQPRHQDSQDAQLVIESLRKK
jgi:hypothetical protein